MWLTSGEKVTETSTKKRLLSATVFWTIISTNWQAIYCIADIAIRMVNVKEVKRANVMEFEAEIQSWRIHISKEDPDQR